MRLTKTFIAAVFGTAALCACTEDLTEMEASGNVLQVSTNVNATTKAIIEGQLGANQKIGISLLATDGSDYNGKTEGYKNVPYNSELLTTGGVNWTAEKPIILSPATGTAYAYYPYSAAVSDIKTIPVETASQTDYMYADPVEGLSSSFAKANFSLNHALCAVQINIKNDSYTQGPGNISRIAVSSAELATAASLNSMTGELSVFSGKGGEIVDTNAFTIGKEAHATTVMAVPTGGQGELSIKITLDGKNHRVRIPIQTPFVKGKRYILDILAKDKTAPLEIVSVDVKPWVEESLGDYPMEVGSYGPDDYAIEVMVADGTTFKHNVRAFTGTINWGDGSETTTHNNEYNPTHTFAKAGKYKVIATGKLTALSLDYLTKMNQITDILYIGEEIGKGITSMYSAFINAKIVKIKPYIFENCPNVTNFGSTFSECSSLTAIPAGLFDNCTQGWDFSETFCRCSALTAIPQGLFDNCTQGWDFNSTFGDCSSLTAIPAGLFDSCTKVSKFRGTFDGCTALTAIPQGLFDNCTQVTDFTSTFGICPKLTTIPKGLFDKCPNVTSFQNTFSGCTALTAIPQGLFDNCTQVTDFDGIFSGCSALTTIPQGLFDNCTKVTWFQNTFQGCSSLRTIPQGLFDKCTNGTSFESTFQGCSSLKTIPQGLFDNSPLVTNFSSTFGECSKITEIPQGLFDSCTKVRKFRGTFDGCTALTEIPAGLFDNCPNVTSISGTFRGCSAITEIPQGLFDNCTEVTSFNGTFDGCTALTAIPQGLFDNCPLVTDFYSTFYGCSALTGESPYNFINGQKVHLYERHLYPEHFTAPTTYGYAFEYCTKLTDYNEIPATWGGGKK